MLGHMIQKMDTFLFVGINHTPLRTKLLDNLMFLVTQLGEGWVEFVMVTAIYYYVFPDKVWYQQAVTAIVLAGLICQLLKKFFPRLRPLSVVSPVYVIGVKLFKGSFPSGHTTTAFALAGIFSYHWPAGGHLFFLASCLVGLSRVYVGAHFPFDVLSGAICGLGTAIAIVALFPV